MPTRRLRGVVGKLFTAAMWFHPDHIAAVATLIGRFGPGSDPLLPACRWGGCREPSMVRELGTGARVINDRRDQPARTGRLGAQSLHDGTAADWFHSLPFSLTGNGSYDLLIVPSVPEGRDWTVTVNCDNGSATTVTKFY